MSLAGKLFAALLKSFPRHRRARYGAEMQEAFERQYSQERARSVWRALRFAQSAYFDLLQSGWRERRHDERKYPMHKDGWFTGMSLDIRHAIRSLTGSWTFTLVCVISLSIGLAINAILVLFMNENFNPPRGVQPKGAVELLVTTKGQVQDDRWSYPDFLDVKRSIRGVAVTGYTSGVRTLRADDSTDVGNVGVSYVSANYFKTVGVPISPGRGFAAEEDQIVAEPPIIVSYKLWRDQLGGSTILGRSLRLNRTVHRVVGVAPPGFRGHNASHLVEAWVPLWSHPLFSQTNTMQTDRDFEWLEVVGRLEGGTSMTQANAAVQSIMTGLAEANPTTNMERRAVVVPYSYQGGGGAAQLLLIKSMFLGLSGMVLFVVCLNVAGMVMVRTASRGRELALRLAMGSSRMRLLRHLMTESTLLALLGGLFSTMIMFILLRVIAVRFNQTIPDDVFVTSLYVCLGLSVLTSFVFGLAPALKFSRLPLLGSLKEGGGGGNRRTGRLHKVATSVQIALALPLLIVNGMFLRGTQAMDGGDYGFKQDNLLLSTIDLDVEGYSDREVEQFLREARERVAGVPGVTEVSIADAVPLDYMPRSQKVSRGGDSVYTWAGGTRVTENYFETIGTPILEGRAILESDAAGAERVAVVTKSLAEHLWPRENALGRRLGTGFGSEVTVVGVSGDVVGGSQDSEPLNVFVSLRQNPSKLVKIVTRVSSESVLPAIRNTLHEIDPDLRPAVTSSRSLMQAEKQEIYFYTGFIGGLSVLTLLLAAIGVYGVVAFSVAGRTREIGVRMAIGASQVKVLGMVLWDGLRLALPGVVVGSLIGAALARWILQQWYDYLKLATIDPIILAAGAATALGVVAFASSMPARRAASVQPIEALRSE